MATSSKSKPESLRDVIVGLSKTELESVKVIEKVDLTGPEKGKDILEKGMIEELIHDSQAKRKNVRNQDSREPVGAAMVLSNSFGGYRKPVLKSPTVDIKLMEHFLVHKLGFMTLSKSFLSTLEYWGVKKMFADISRLELDQYPSFLFYYSGHADESGILLPSGHLFEYREIIDSVCQCRSLREKPKIFVFDCSRVAVVPTRSIRPGSASRSSENSNSSTERGRLSQNDLPCDCLIIFAAGHHQSAVGHPEEGSYFTQDFVKTLGCYIDDNIPVRLGEALANVCKLVREYALRNAEMLQKPEVLSTLNVPVMLPSLCKFSI